MNYLTEHVNILDKKGTAKERLNLYAILEDSTSPDRNRYVNELLSLLMEKSHIDFGDIPDSRGDIEKYKGYNGLVECIDILTKLMSTESEPNEYVNEVNKALNTLKINKIYYIQGFNMQNDYIELEYNSIVLAIIMATSTLMKEFVETVKSIDGSYKLMTMSMNNKQYKPDMHFINIVVKFNKVIDNDHKKFLTAIRDVDIKDNFLGSSTLIGIGVVTGGLLLLVPIIRELVYSFYKYRVKISEYMEQQASFIELNKSILEANAGIDSVKKMKIIKKQEGYRKSFLKISDKLKLEQIKASKNSKKNIEAENKDISISNINSKIDNNDFVII